MTQTFNNLYGEEVEGKICIICDEFKTLDMYGSRTRNKNGEPVELRNDCKSCLSKKSKRVNELKKEHAYDPETHKCEICKRSAEDFSHKYNGNPFCLDHNHKTGEFRGYICMDCNTGLARFQDNPEIVAEAEKYLIKYGSKNGNVS